MIVVPGKHFEIAASPAHRFAPTFLRVSEVAHHAYPERIEPFHVIRRQVRQDARAVDASIPDAAAIVGLITAQIAKISSAFEDQLSFHARASTVRSARMARRYRNRRTCTNALRIMDRVGSTGEGRRRAMYSFVCKRSCPLSTLGRATLATRPERRR